MALSRYLPRSRLFFRIILVNLVGIIVLGAGIFFVSNEREALVEAHKANILSQARIISSALSEAASEAQFQFLPGPSLLGSHLGDRMTPDWRVVEAAQIVARLTNKTNIRVRLYARNGRLLVDSEGVSRRGGVVLRELPPLGSAENSFSWVAFESAIRKQFGFPGISILTDDLALNGANLEEVRLALSGRAATGHRRDEAGQDMVTVGMPVQAYRAIIGGLFVTSKPGEIDRIIYAERINFLKLIGVAILVAMITSLFLARTISVPVSKLSRAAGQFSNRVGALPSADVIPDFSVRGDEVGDLSVTLRAMVKELLERLNTIDQFAADVSHELKNPLTSLHSAVQSLSNAKNPDDREALMAIIEQDVARLNRLISDISAASRLDTALSRDLSERFDLSELVGEMSAIRATTIASHQNVELTVDADEAIMVEAPKEQIAQIIDNLILNSISFAPSGTSVKMIVRRNNGEAELLVIDEGAGLVDGTEERIFERFYTDRSNAVRHEARSGHSGLGLSISRQTARAYGGDLVAYNRLDGKGACFRLSLPLKLEG